MVAAMNPQCVFGAIKVGLQVILIGRNGSNQ